jgi:hypothetical protein
MYPAWMASRGLLEPNIYRAQCSRWSTAMVQRTRVPL